MRQTPSVRLHHVAAGLLVGLGLLLRAPAVGLALDVPLTIVEPAGVQRAAEPVTSGVPLPPGTAASTWSLWDGTRELPLQVTVLPGRTPWLLLDFQVSMPASGTKALTLRSSASSASPTGAVTVAEDSTTIRVETGVLKVAIGKGAFNLFDAVWIDRDGDGAFSAAEQVASASGDNILLVDSSTGQTFSGSGVPDRVTWEYRGVLRSTLRVDGRYRSGAAELVGYTTRLTFYAGQPFVKIDHVLRNSYRPNERHVKLRSATLRIGGAGTAVRAARSGSTSWANVTSGGATFQIVPASLWGIDTASNGGMVLPDLSHHGATLVADFSEGLASAEQTRRAAASRSPLFANAPAAWYSNYGSLSTIRFSTLDDEKQANRNWGWSWTSSQEPRDAAKPDYAVSWKNVAVHDDSEADDVWQNFLMYLRTGQRGYFDRARAWARYYKWEYTFRTDGFDFDLDPDPDILRTTRPPLSIPLTATDSAYLDNDVKLGRVDHVIWRADHLWGWGLVDFYYLTGDVDALEAALDLAEVSTKDFAWRTPGTQNMGVNARWGARHLLLVSRVWEATLRANLRDLMGHIAELFVQAPDWDARGLYYYTDSSMPGAKVTAALYVGAISHAFEYYYRLTGDTRIRDRLVAIADWVVNYTLDPTLQYSSAFVALDYPSPGQSWLARVSPFYTLIWADTLVRGYRVTGNRAYLDRARYYWDRGSKAVDGTPPTRVVSDSQVGKFLNSTFLSNDTFYVDNGELPYVHLLFYEATHAAADTVPPLPPSRLTVR